MNYLFTVIVFGFILAESLAQPQGQPYTPSITNCPENYGLQTYPDPDYCDSFFKCANGTLTHEVCGNGLIYDEAKAFYGAVHNHCVYNWDGSCGNRKYDDTPQPSGPCEYQFGLYPIDYCAPSYYKCAYGTPEESACETGLAYDARIHGCNWPDLLEKCDPSTFVGFNCPQTQNEIADSLTRRFWPFPRFAYKGQPDSYITCVNGQPRLQRCGYGTVFAENYLSCIEV
ncbi:unnamed protein product [Lepeophtheirus salmonis]|uniref:(salmon louse) hypothetical protein n=1 Tax=Lepeophtheirus salmonis TaxID=72036 RepID=A0A7R8HCH6_LEPSM|nr:unnamed protein product [Lepeophtheirus salmonis]CAF2992005.1 unnamed protein product [Lepeophtheirus salmonis]